MEAASNVTVHLTVDEDGRLLGVTVPKGGSVQVSIAPEHHWTVMFGGVPECIASYDPVCDVGLGAKPGFRQYRHHTAYSAEELIALARTKDVDSHSCPKLPVKS